MKGGSEDAFRYREWGISLKDPRSICMCGLFVALYVLLSMFSIRITSYMEFRFLFLAIAAAAAYGGPVMGMTVGAIGDTVSCFVLPQSGAFFPGFTLSYAIIGLCFGLTLYRSRITLPCAAAAAGAQFAVACTLDTLWLHMMYGMEWEYLFTIRLIKNSIALGVDFIMLYEFMKLYVRVIARAYPARRSSRKVVKE